MAEAVSWFEIPAADFDRAVKFYKAIFEKDLTQFDAETRKIALLPAGATPESAGGAILHTKNFEPSNKGTIVYLDAGKSMDPVLDRIKTAGGRIDMPKTEIGQGYLATFVDSEGNVVGLHSMG